MKTLHSTSAEAPKMYETENDISLQRRTQLNALMNQRLASAVDLQMQMKQAHWNVKGPSFIGLHELFDKVAEAVEGYVDEIAERIVQLGGVAEGTVRMAAARTRLTEYRRKFPKAWRMSKAWRARCPHSVRKPATQSMKPMNWTTRTRRICSPKFRAA
jgi:DNA-binding ferritin-like protein